MKKIEAIIVADSINIYGNRITTFVLTFPRIVLSEFNTHRALSKNSASSRAIPFSKPTTRSGMLEKVKDDPFIPISWMKDHTGMQGNSFFTDSKEIEELEYFWVKARDLAILQAKKLSSMGLTKQIVNRLLEPFMWHTVIVTGTEWENFFALRAHNAAEIHIQKLAYEILEAYNNSCPKLLQPGQWHIPFGDRIDGDISEQDKIKIATARCARVSYDNFEGTNDYIKDIQLHDRLAESGHMSPFEHCAKTMNEEEYNNFYAASMIDSEKNITYEKGWLGNFRGFIQYRKTFKEENRKDPRITLT
jgi:thymidylate synthase ThyX